MSKSKKTTPANLVWFEIPADQPERAKEFYAKLFGWKISPFPQRPITTTLRPAARMLRLTAG